MIRRSGALALALTGVILAASSEASAQVQFRGRALVSADAFFGSNGSESTLTLEPHLRFGLPDGSSLTFMPAAWIDLSSDSRTVVDPIRFEWKKNWNAWELMLGASEISWGVMESHRAVDVVNQRLPTSSFESLRKLAQPMARVSVIQPWGTITAYLMPDFRERPFVGRAGTLWADTPIDDDRPIFEDRDSLIPIDWAARWSHEFGAFDFAISHFVGRSRDASFVEANVDNSLILRPTYDLTNQTSLEAQWTSGRWLLKGEALIRSWRDKRIGAFAVGAEYVVADYFSLFAEYLADSRGPDAPNSFENDVYIGARLVFDRGSLMTGVFVDTESGNRLGRVSLLRLLTDRFGIKLEATGFGGDSRAEPRHALGHETFLSLGLVAYF